MKIVLWGAGEIGKRIQTRVPRDVVAFIDSDEKKIGGVINGTPIISYDTYRDKYSQYFILLACLNDRDIVCFLERNRWHKYFRLVELPGEWFDYNERRAYKEYIDEVACLSYGAIYGCNFHAVKLAEVIKSKTGNSPVLIANPSARKDLVNAVRTDICDVMEMEKVKDLKLDAIYIATGEDIEVLNDFDVKKIETWDCSGIIEEYNHPELKKYKDLYKKERCFIIGNGPSLSVNDLSKLKEKEYCFGVNSIFDIYANTDWRPDFYVTGDMAWLSTNQFRENVCVKDYRAVFVTDRMQEKFYNDADFEIVHMQANVPNGKETRFSFDIEKGVYYGATILYACMQIAVYMGFSELYLLGVDFTGGKDATSIRYKHFDGKYDTGKLYNEVIYQAYLAAKNAEDRGGFRIYNATRGGELEVFERVDFDSLFN